MHEVLIRSLHAGKPFTLSKTCEDMGRYTICYGNNLIIVNEIDVGEVYDITLYRAMVLFTDGGFMDRMLRGALVSAMSRFSVPDAHAGLGDYLPPVPLPDTSPPELDPWGFTTKPAAIARIQQYRYIRVLREARTENDYVESMEDAPLIVTLSYWVETLAHVAKRNAARIARLAEERYGVRSDIVEHAIRRAYCGAPIELVVDDAVMYMRDSLPRASVDWESLSEYIVDTVYNIVEEGDYIPPKLVGIALYRNGRYVAGGCDAARDAYTLLPERDQEEVRRQCRIGY